MFLGLNYEKNYLEHIAVEYILNLSIHFVIPCFPSGKSKKKLSL